MKLILPQVLTICAAALATASPTKFTEQQLLVGVDIMTEQDKVPGHNNATYGPVPKEDQLLDVTFLEIAPTPILAYAPLSIDQSF